MPQPAYRITIDLHAETIGHALAIADEISGTMTDLAHIVVTDQPEGVDSDGVFCVGCDGHTIAGVRWATAINGDTSHSWVERCDTCQRYATDVDAANRVVELYNDPTVARLEFAEVEGVSGPCPYIAGDVAAPALSDLVSSRAGNASTGLPPTDDTMIGWTATFNYQGHLDGSKDAAHAGQTGTIVAIELDAETGKFYELCFADGYRTWTYPGEVTQLRAGSA